MNIRFLKIFLLAGLLTAVLDAQDLGKGGFEIRAFGGIVNAGGGTIRITEPAAGVQGAFGLSRLSPSPPDTPMTIHLILPLSTAPAQPRISTSRVKLSSRRTAQIMAFNMSSWADSGFLPRIVVQSLRT